MLAVGGARFVEHAAGARELAGGERAREDETLEAEAVAGIEQAARAFDVGALVVGMALAGEVGELAAGVNDLGGTLMNESISRAAGSEWGQQLPREQMEAVIR